MLLLSHSAGSDDCAHAQVGVSRPGSHVHSLHPHDEVSPFPWSLTENTENTTDECGDDVMFFLTDSTAGHIATLTDGRRAQWNWPMGWQEAPTWRTSPVTPQQFCSKQVGERVVPHGVWPLTKLCRLHTGNLHKGVQGKLICHRSSSWKCSQGWI